MSAELQISYLKSRCVESTSSDSEDIPIREVRRPRNTVLNPGDVEFIGSSSEMQFTWFCYCSDDVECENPGIYDLPSSSGELIIPANTHRLDEDYYIIMYARHQTSGEHYSYRLRLISRREVFIISPGASLCASRENVLTVSVTDEPSEYDYVYLLPFDHRSYELNELTIPIQDNIDFLTTPQLSLRVRVTHKTNGEVSLGTLSIPLLHAATGGSLVFAPSTGYPGITNFTVSMDGWSVDHSSLQYSVEYAAGSDTDVLSDYADSVSREVNIPIASTLLYTITLLMKDDGGCLTTHQETLELQDPYLKRVSITIAGIEDPLKIPISSPALLVAEVESATNDPNNLSFQWSSDQIPSEVLAENLEEKTLQLKSGSNLLNETMRISVLVTSLFSTEEATIEIQYYNDPPQGGDLSVAPSEGIADESILHFKRQVNGLT